MEGQPILEKNSKNQKSEENRKEKRKIQIIV